MIGILRAVTVGLALAGAALVGPAAAEKFEISQEVHENYQEYLKKISGFEVAVFAVSEDGNRSFYVWCDENCSLARLSQEAVEECERRNARPCKVMAVNHDLRIEYEVFASTAAVASDDKVMAHLLGAEDLKRAITGNTIKGEYPNGVPWAEFYDPSGEIRGEDKTNGTYTAKYTFRDDLLCYDYEGNDDDWCSQVSAAGDNIEFLKDGKLVTFIRNASIVAGNPNNF